MGIADLLNALKTVIQAALEGMLLEVNPDTGDYEEDHNLPLEPDDMESLLTMQQTATEKKCRAPTVYLMNLPEREDYLSRIPYVLIQFLSSKDKHDKESNERQSLASVRVLIAVYDSDGEDGGLHVLEIIERIRLKLQAGMLLDQNFMLQMPFDTEVYPDDTGNYFLGEINMDWSIPVIDRTKYYIEETERRTEWP